MVSPTDRGVGPPEIMRSDLESQCSEQIVNQYKVKIYGNWHGIPDMTEDDSKDVTFVDHSEEFQDPREPGSRKRPHEVSLPDPQLIAIHAAIAGVLHMSGAGGFFDNLFEKLGGDGDTALPVTWDEFETGIKLAEIRHTLRLPLLTAY